jgi:hypothetical protein
MNGGNPPQPLQKFQGPPLVKEINEKFWSPKIISFFIELSKKINWMIKIKGDNFPIILLMNKCKWRYQIFSSLATVTITGDRAANFDLCLALTAFSSEGSSTCHTTVTRDLRF